MHNSFVENSLRRCDRTRRSWSGGWCSFRIFLRANSDSKTQKNATQLFCKMVDMLHGQTLAQFSFVVIVDYILRLTTNNKHRAFTLHLTWINLIDFIISDMIIVSQTTTLSTRISIISCNYLWSWWEDDTFALSARLYISTSSSFLLTLHKSIIDICFLLNTISNFLLFNFYLPGKFRILLCKVRLYYLQRLLA